MLKNTFISVSSWWGCRCSGSCRLSSRWLEPKARGPELHFKWLYGRRHLPWETWGWTGQETWSDWSGCVRSQGGHVSHWSCPLKKGFGPSSVNLGGGSGTARESLTWSVLEVSLTLPHLLQLRWAALLTFLKGISSTFSQGDLNLVSQNNIATLFVGKFQNPHRSKTRKYTTENTVENVPVWAGRWTAGLNQLFGTVAISKKSDEVLKFRAGSVILALYQFRVFIGYLCTHSELGEIYVCMYICVYQLLIFTWSVLLLGVLVLLGEVASVNDITIAVILKSFLENASKYLWYLSHFITR